MSIPGGSSETPIDTTVSDVEINDDVMVEWRNNRLHIIGNNSAPSTSSTTVTKMLRPVEEAAQIAGDAAEVARQSAATAAGAASEALASASDALASATDAATQAQEATNNAIDAQEKANAAGESASIAQYAANAAAEAAGLTQEELDAFKEYFYHDQTGAHVLSDTDETTGYRYRQDMAGSGQIIYRLNPDGTQTAVAKYGESAVVGDENEAHIEISGNRQSFKIGENEVAYIAVDENGDAVFYMTKAIIVKDLRFAKWRWATRGNDNLALKWVGDE